MQKKLLSGLIFLFHITLISLPLQVSAYQSAQPAIGTGDILIVTVNTGDSSSVDIIPLIKLPAGTEVFVTNRRWDEKAEAFYGGGFSEKRTLSEGLEKGQPLRFTAFGQLNTDQDHLYLYSLANNGDKHLLFGVFWDTQPSRLFRKSNAEEIPGILKEQSAFVKFSESGNYQYHIQHGASGTTLMLKELVSNQKNWMLYTMQRPVFGTAFQLLKPPVVQFTNIRSVTDEREKKLKLNIAVYEHDGSDMRVAVRFAETQSSLSANELEGARRFWFNFEGLKGDAVFDISFSFKDDDDFEPTELAVFMLDSLTKGSYGDFRIHNSFIRDNDIPDVSIVNLLVNPQNHKTGDTNFDGISDQLQDQFLIIQNQEDVEVDISGWRLNAPKTIHQFGENLILAPGETITVFGGGQPDSLLFSDQRVFTSSEGALNLKDDGSKVRLINQKGNLISEISLNKVVKETSENSSSMNLAASNSGNAEAGINTQTESNSATQLQRLMDFRLPVVPGWYHIPTNVLDLIPEIQTMRYSWNPALQRFEDIGALEYADQPSALVYLEEAHIDMMNEFTVPADEYEEKVRTDWNIEISDANEDGYLSAAEGVLFLSNPFSIPLPADKLSYLLSSRLQLDQKDIHLFTQYKDDLNRNREKMILAEESIPPFSSFILCIRQPVPPTTITFSPDELMNLEAPEMEMAAAEATGLAVLSLQSGSLQSELQIEFMDSDSIRFHPDLNTLLQLDIHEKGLELFAVEQGFSTSRIQIPESFEAPIEIPLQFVSDGSYEATLSVAEWDEVPYGIRMQLIDSESREESALEEGMSYDLNIPVTSATDLPLSDLPFSLMEVRKTAILRILPEGFIEEDMDAEIPEEMELYQNYPNPFNPITTISFFLPEPDEVRLSIYNVVGQPVATLINGELSQGEHQVEWNGSTNPSGIYIYQLEVGNKIMTRKMTLVK